VCIGDKDMTTEGGLQFLSWPSVLKSTKVIAQPSYLKMDIEGFEYDVMRSILRSDASQSFPEQISMEIHTSTYRPGSGNPAGNLPWANREKGGGELLAFMLMLYESGYRLIFVDWATVCNHCIEVLFARIYC